MLMNDPTRDYYKCYEIDYDRHVYDGRNWTYVNLPVEEIKRMAVASIRDSTMMYFSCDVGKFLDSGRGLLDVDNFDYESLMGTTFEPCHDACGRRPRCRRAAEEVDGGEQLGAVERLQRASDHDRLLVR